MNIKRVPFVKLGNKKMDIKHFINYLPFDSKKIIEPFCGSFAVSRLLYDPEKYTIHINDIDSNLYYILTHMDAFVKFRVSLMDYYANNKDIKAKDLKAYIDSFDNIDNSFKETINQSCFVRGAVVKVPKIKYDYSNLIKFLNKVEITNDNFNTTMDKYINDQDAFLFCDPPYFGSDNTNYKTFNITIDKDNKIIDNTYIYVYLSKFIKICKCRIMIVINDNAILRYLFDGYIKATYDKLYSISKKKDTLMIITNY